ncbi:Spectrin beta chain erythrocytic [Taenia crassiceps]|uniref:Spectrin beta chain erythrocytic n=1 Tax=Taenia crassiceps TaxID=6207 RepID=A0ABR4Q945_9CEST
MTSIDAFEKTRVQYLSESRALQQKKIFTNWINAQLELADQMSYEKSFSGSCLKGDINTDNIEAHFALIFKGDESLFRVKDLYKDLSDGRVLLRLLRFFTGRKITLSRGTTRVHSLENVSKALDQMKQLNIHLQNIGPIDIVDGNVHLILGLIWTFILNFQLSRPPFIHHLKQESPNEMKNALLRWCQLKTALYPQINIANFTSSWRDGLAMCALLHRHRPYLIDFAALASATTTPMSRLSEAFALAKKDFGIPIIVSPADFIACSNDERCVVAIVATWYYRLNEDQEFKKSASRLAVVLDRVVTSERRMMAYVKEVYALRRWMKTNLQYLMELSKVDDIKLISSKLARWRENEKEKKVKKSAEIEYAWLQLRTQNLAWGYFLPSPPPGFDYPTVYRTWAQLDEAEAACMEQIQQGRKMEASNQQKLAQRKKELEEKTAMLCVEKEKLHQELCTLKKAVDLLSSIPTIQAEANAITEWIHHELAYFVKFPIPDVLTELLNSLDGSNECWWEELFCKNMVFQKHLHIQSRIQQKCRILTEITELRKALDEIEQRFPLTTYVNPEDQLPKDSIRSFKRITTQTQKTIRLEMTKLHQSLNEFNQEVTTRHEHLLAEQMKVHAIQRCCDLLQWIHRSKKCLSGIESPFLHLSPKASTESFDLTMNEPFLVALEKEVDFHSQTSLPILHDFRSRLLGESSWNSLLGHTYDAWNDLIHFAKIKRLSITTAKRLVRLNGELSDTRCWVKHKKELLLTTGETKNTMQEMIRMECRMDGWETDLNALKERVRQMFEDIDTLGNALDELQSPLIAESESVLAVRDAKLTLEESSSRLHAEWEEFASLLNEYHKRLEASLAFQSMMQELETMNTALMSRHNTITSLELPSSISEIDAQLEVFHTIATELEALSEKLEALMVHGKDLAANQEEIVAVTVTERLDTLKCEWSELLILCNHQLGSLAHQRDIKILLHDIEGLNASLSRKENQIVQTDYLPTIEHLRGKIMTQKQVLVSIQALSDQVRLLQLKSKEHKFGEKYDARVRTVAARYTNIQEKAANALRLLEFRLTEKEKLNQLKSIEEWILERQTTVTAQFIAIDATLQEQKAIQKYHLFRNFEAEVKSYGLLASEIFQNVKLTIEENQTSSANLREALDGNMKLWNELNTTVSVQGGRLVEVYRAIIISEGCEELLEWLKRAAVKIFGLQIYDYKKLTNSPLQSSAPRCVSTTSLLADPSEPGSLPRLKQRSVSENYLQFLTTSGVNCADTFDLSALNTAMVKINELKQQMQTKCSFLQELEQHYQCLMENTDKFAQHEEKLRHVNTQFDKVKKWLTACALSVTTHREVIDMLRTLKDENQWLAQKEIQLSNESTALSLLEVQKLLIRHQTITAEVNHRKVRNSPLVKTAIEWLQTDEALRAKVIHSAKEKACCVAFITAHRDLSKELLTKASELVFRQAVVQREIGVRRSILEHWQAWFVQHMDLLELYNWLTETESTVMTECHAARGLASAHAAIKKHSAVEAIVTEFQAPRLRYLSTRTANILYATANMIATEQKKLLGYFKITALFVNTDEAAKAKAHRHKLRRRIHMLERSSAKLLSTQKSVQKQFTGLRDLVMEKKHRLYELLALNRLYEEVNDVEEWIWSRTEEALIDNTGRDLDEWARLQREFCDTHQSLIRNGVTEQLGYEDLTSAPKLPNDFALLGQLPSLPDSPERLIRAIMVCRQMISLKHSDSPQIAQWQDRLNEDWCELRELLRTRGELLKSAGNRLLFLRRCEEAITDLREKMDSLPAILGADLQVLARQRRQHTNFRQSVIPIGKRVNWVVRAANLLLPLYADVRAVEIKTQRLHLLEAWDQLNATVEVRSQMLQEAEALSRWLTWLHHSLGWIASAQRIISSAHEHEVQELEADRGGKLLQHELPGVMSQHKLLWNEICTRESSIQLHCEEAIAANSCHCVLETVDFETSPTFIGIRKMLARSVTQLKTDWCFIGSRSSDVTSAIQKSVFTSLCEAKPMLPSRIIQSGAVLLIIYFHQLKIAWWRYWRHLEALTARLNLLRDLRNLEMWLTSMEDINYGNDLGSSLEETMVLAEEHRKFSLVVALQGEKCQRLAEFEMAQLEESDPGWETAMENRMMEKLERLNVLPKIMSTSETIASETVSLQEEVKPIENAAFERMEGVLYRKLVNQRHSSSVKNVGRWQKCYALLKPNTVTLHVLNISGPPTIKRSWISENAGVDFRLPLCREMVANLVEQRAAETGLFKIHNLSTGEYQIFKAKTNAMAERWVAALNETCSKSPTMEECEQQLMQTERLGMYSSSKSLPPTGKSQFTTCLPILRLISKRSGQSYNKRRLQYPRQRRRHSGSSTSTTDEETEIDAEMPCTRALSPHTLPPSLKTPTKSSCTQSRSLVGLTLPLRVLCHRATRHSNPPISVTQPSRLSINTVLSVGNDGSNGDSSGGVCDIVAVIDDESSPTSSYATKGAEFAVRNGNGNDKSETDIDDVDEFS